MIDEERRAALGFRFWDDDSPTDQRKKGTSMPAIQAIVMPKWGLAMEEGMLARWSVDEGATISLGDEIMDIETSKIANAFESLVSGVLRRKVVGEGETVPVGALLGVVADVSTSDAEVEAFVADFLANFKVTAKSGDSGPQPEMIEAGGKKLRHLRVGPDSGTPVVFIHGFGGDYLTWAFNQGTVGEDRPAYAVELPGHGGSTKDVGDATVETFAATVAAYLDAIGAKRAHLVGHSLGGAIAMTIALNTPDKVGALSLISPSGFGKEISDAFISGYIRESRPRKLRPVLEMLVADPSLVTAQMVEDTLKFKRLDGAVAALEKIAAVNFPAGKQSIWLRDRIGEIEAPIQVMWGVADHVVPVSQADGLPASVKVTRIADAGHIPHIEKADEVSKLVRALA